MPTIRAYAATHTAECPDCGLPLVETTPGGTLFGCGTEGHDPLAWVDVYLEWNETKDVVAGVLTVTEWDEREDAA